VAESFIPTMLQALSGTSIWLLLVLPFCAYLLTLRKIGGTGKKKSAKVISFVLTFFFLFLLGGATGAYPNSYVSKNLNDPLTSSGALYFYWSRHIEADQVYQKPTKALEVVLKSLSGEKSPQPEYQQFPLVRTRSVQTCASPQEQNEIGKSLCGSKKPNVLFILLESFRAAEVGVLGSKVQLTPNFDRWSKKGIFFKNFFANGFQTRHGMVAAYCSLMPNYGPAIMKRYKKNNFHCLPQELKKRGYQTSWAFGSDAAFDDQVNFLPKIGFDLLVDRFDFPSDTETLGWGYSDKALFDKWLDMLDQHKEPFFSSSLTITNHHPFEAPKEYQLFDAKDDTHRYYETIYYTDAMLGEFLEKAQQKKWYKNTLIFIMADTANYQQPQQPYADVEDFIRTRSQIPMLIVGGAVKQGVVVEDYFSQIDLGPTVMDLLGEKFISPWAGVSMLSKNTPAIAFTNRPGNYWAVMSQQGKLFNENDSKDTFKDFTKAALKEEYKQLGKSWIDVTRWLLQEDLYWKK